METRRRPPAFQFYPKDFLTDEKVQLMSNTELGVYIRLICCCWLEGSLPLETDALAHLSKTPLRQFTKLWENSIVKTCFRVSDDGRLHHKRLDDERKKQNEYRRRQSDKGKLGGRPVKATVKPELFTEKATTITTAKAGESSPISDLQSSSASAEREIAPRGRTVFDGSLPRDHVNHAHCSPNFAWCVPSVVHRKFLTLLTPKFSGDHGKTVTALETFYFATWGRLSDEQPDLVMGDAFKFWQPLFDAEFVKAPMPSTPSAPTNKRIAGLITGGNAFLNRSQS